MRHREPGPCRTVAGIQLERTHEHTTTHVQAALHHAAEILSPLQVIVVRLFESLVGDEFVDVINRRRNFEQLESPRLEALTFGVEPTRELRATRHFEPLDQIAVEQRQQFARARVRHLTETSANDAPHLERIDKTTVEIEPQRLVLCLDTLEPDDPAQFRQCPTQLAARIHRAIPQQRAETMPRHSTRRKRQISEQRANLPRRRQFDRIAVARDA